MSVTGLGPWGTNGGCGVEDGGGGVGEADFEEGGGGQAAVEVWVYEGREPGSGRDEGG